MPIKRAPRPTIGRMGTPVLGVVAPATVEAGRVTAKPEEAFEIDRVTV